MVQGRRVFALQVHHLGDCEWFRVPRVISHWKRKPALQRVTPIEIVIKISRRKPTGDVQGTEGRPKIPNPKPSILNPEP